MKVLNFILFSFTVLIICTGGIQTYSMFKKWVEFRFENHLDDRFQFLLILVGSIIFIGCSAIWAIFIWPYFEELPA